MISAQTLGRKVFASGGADATVGATLYHFNFTIGEAMIGRSTGVLPLLTKGFQQPDMVIPLAFGVTDFRGEWEGENVMLTWKLLGEGTGGHISIERASMPHAFHQVGEVALGSQTAYAFVDESPSPISVQRFYYRLHISSPAGQWSYSSVISVFRDRGAPQFSLYPNPADHGISLSWQNMASGQAVIQLFNSLGQKVADWKMEISESEEADFDIRHVTSGTYYLRFEVEGAVWVKKLVVI